MRSDAASGGASNRNIVSIDHVHDAGSAEDAQALAVRVGWGTISSE
jgi:hypothetical protein